MIFQLISRQSSEGMSTPADALCVQLIFSAVAESAPDNPPGPGIYTSTLQMAATRADSALYTMGDYYALNLDQVAPPSGE